MVPVSRIADVKDLTPNIRIVISSKTTPEPQDKLKLGRVVGAKERRVIFLNVHGAMSNDK